jgi:hypothetical protein
VDANAQVSPVARQSVLSFVRRADDVPDALHASVWRDRVEGDDCALGASGTGREMDTVDRSSARLSNDNVPDLGETLGFIDDIRQASER